MLLTLSLRGLQSYRSFDEIATDASVGGFGNKKQPGGGDRVNPASGSDAAVVDRSRVGQQVSVPERCRAEGQ